MTRTDLDPVTRAAFDDLDPAPRDLDAAARARADATLARVLASDPSTPVRALPALPRRRRLRVLAVLAAVVTLTASALVVPGVVRTQSAAAAWTPRPISVSPGEVAAARDACKDLLGPKGFDTAEGDPWAEALRRSRAVAVDRRGAWRFVVLTDGAGFTGDCLLQDPPLLLRLFGSHYGGAFGGTSMGRVLPPAPDGVAVDTAGSGSSDDDAWGVVSGLAGADVRRVVVTSPDGRESVASLGDGRFAAWWPQRRTGMANVRLTLTLADGRVLPARSLEQIAAEAAPAG
ncbi:hypothetical protein [Phycicoccus flavus]|uniref:hypothetical protein n=1 Tax=Phycicoccus flavus TaxID=2502783 RepID=UPI000FEBD5BE|nr:hypothetical protein [Phycicoccus flavus]NHA68925.1 hypothetical protein [Phycicoccus flavus]